MRIFNTKTLLVLFFVLGIVLIINCNILGQIIYVDQNASGSNDGSSWADAYTDLQSALSTASSGDQIWVAHGTYLPAADEDRTASFNIPDGVEVYGGFSGTESSIGERTDFGSGGSNETILSGDIGTNGDQNDNSYHVVNFSTSVGSSTILDGFTISNGNSLNTDGSDFSGNGAAILNMGSPNILNCTIKQNNSWSDGGAIYNYSNTGSINPSFSNCQIIENSSQLGAGAGVCNFAEGGIINSSFTNCIINENYAFQSYGGAISNMSDLSGSSTVILTNCKIMGNSSSFSGGGIDNDNGTDATSTVTLVNCLITGNKSNLGGGIANFFEGDGWSTNLNLTNCTIACNYATSNGGGIYNDGSPSNPAIKNCIIWNNQENSSTTTIGASIDNENGASPTISYSTIANSGGSISWDGSAGNDGGNNIDQDPEFQGFPDPSGAPSTVGDFHVVAYSPALGSGSPKTDAGIPSSDIEGNSRPLPSSDNNIDMGAYEENYDGSLPVELTSFSATLIDNSVKLLWKTATEVNNYGFEIERQLTNDNSSQSSLVNGQWTSIGFVKGNGNSNSPKQYSFVDNSPDGGPSISYRIKQIDNNGDFKYYDPITVKLNVSNKIELLQNNPNPFNPSTSIKFYIPKTSNVTIKIYDLTGREIETLFNEQTSPGYHIIYWNGKDKIGNQAASGVYLYRLTNNNFVKTKKMILLK